MNDDVIGRVAAASEPALRRWLTLLGKRLDQNTTPIGSPIELMMFSALSVLAQLHAGHKIRIMESTGLGEAARARAVADSADGVDTWLFPQAPIGRYRADILIAYACGGIVVECDGHEFHERTKQQAQHDKARDRYLQRRGYKVLRFTGSEIWLDPFKGAFEVLMMVVDDQIKLARTRDARKNPDHYQQPSN